VAKLVEANEVGADDCVVVSLSGRGDKDVELIERALKRQELARSHAT